MVDVPVWMQEALQSRCEAVVLEAFQQPQIKPLQDKVQQKQERFKQALTEGQWLLFLEWEEECSYVQGLEQQWAYKLGLKDGAQLLFGLLQSGESRPNGCCGFAAN